VIQARQIAPTNDIQFGMRYVLINDDKVEFGYGGIPSLKIDLNNNTVKEFIADFQEVGFTNVTNRMAAWAPGMVVSVGTYVNNDGKVYLSTTSGTTGSTPPTWTSGTSSDGGVSWAYVSTYDPGLSQGVRIKPLRGNYDLSSLFAYAQAADTGINPILAIKAFSSYYGGAEPMVLGKDCPVAELRMLANRIGGSGGTAQGVIQFKAGSVTQNGGNAEKIPVVFQIQGTDITPGADNIYNLGNASLRWKEIFAATGTINTSDLEQKTDIQDEPLGLDFINRLRPVQFKYKDSGNRTETGEIIPGIRPHHGLIAQEVERVLNELGIDHGMLVKTPEVVLVPDENWVPDETKGETEENRPLIEKKTGKYHYGLRYTEIISSLIKAIQELSREINELKTKMS